jgi:uncharacterized protein YfkK (UPF0435 family)
MVSYGTAEFDWIIDSPPTPSPFQVDIMKPEELKFIDTTTMLMTVAYDSHEMIQEMRAEQEKMVTMLRRISDKLNVDSDDVLGPEATSNDGTSVEEELVQDVDDEIAREMIIEYMKGHEQAWPEDISRYLRLDFAQVIRITRKLLDEGVLSDSRPE